MIRIKDRVSYALPGNKPLIKDAQVIHIYFCANPPCVELAGYPRRTFPLRFLTKSF